MARLVPMQKEQGSFCLPCYSPDAEHKKTASQLSSKDQKPLWQEWPGRPVPLRKPQLGCRALASLFELAAIIYFTWLCSNWQGCFFFVVAGFLFVCFSFRADSRWVSPRYVRGLHTS